MSASEFSVSEIASTPWQFPTQNPNQGPTVHLVGAGPGDPLLLTRRAARLLAAADVVVADRHSMDGVVALAPAEAERIYVGQADGEAAWPIEAIADLLADRAGKGLVVVRLKGGDPFVCSRGGEEADALSERGVDCQVTPGVTAATAAPLVAGLSRGALVTIASGDVASGDVASGDDDPLAPPVPWKALANPAASIVVLTGRAHQRPIADDLLAGGLPGATPTTLVHGASRPGQRWVTTRLDALGTTRLPPPAAFVVGPVDTEGAGRAHP